MSALLKMIDRLKTVFPADQAHDISRDYVDAIKKHVEKLEAERNAAVEDIKSMEVGPQTFPPDICTICKKNNISCSTGGSACKGFDWRGFEKKGKKNEGNPNI